MVRSVLWGELSEGEEFYDAQPFLFKFQILLGLMKFNTIAHQSVGRSL